MPKLLGQMFQKLEYCRRIHTDRHTDKGDWTHCHITFAGCNKIK